MRVIVIGATGHIGTYLVPRLVRAGHHVVVLSRGTREPYQPDPAWDEVERVAVDRDAHDRAGTFGPRVADLTPDVVVDLVCFTEASARHLVESLLPLRPQLLMCGSIWVHGTPTEVPVTEDAERHPWGDYGIKKAAIEQFLLHQAGQPGGVPATVLHPGHISGPGWPVINPVGNLDLEVWQRLATGREVVLPNLGLEMVHHVHADDVAQAFELAMANVENATGQSFHVTSERALTLRGFATAAAAWFGQQAVLSYQPFTQFTAGLAPESANISAAHITRSHCVSIDKARRLLGYRPRYTSLAAAAEAVRWQLDHGLIRAAARFQPDC